MALDEGTAVLLETSRSAVKFMERKIQLYIVSCSSTQLYIVAMEYVLSELVILLRIYSEV